MFSRCGYCGLRRIDNNARSLLAGVQHSSQAICSWEEMRNLEKAATAKTWQKPDVDNGNIFFSLRLKRRWTKQIFDSSTFRTVLLSPAPRNQFRHAARVAHSCSTEAPVPYFRLLRYSLWSLICKSGKTLELVRVYWNVSCLCPW